MDLVGGNLAGGDNLLNLSDDKLASSGHGGVEVTGSVAEHKVTLGVSLPGLVKSNITGEGLLHEVLASLELTNLARLGLLDHIALGVIADGEASLLDHGSDSSGSVESGNASSASTDTLSKRTLRDQLNTDITSHVLGRDFLRKPNAREDRLANLLVGKKNGQSISISTNIVEDSKKVFDTSITNRFNQLLRDSTRSKAARHDSHS